MRIEPAAPAAGTGRMFTPKTNSHATVEQVTRPSSAADAMSVPALVGCPAQGPVGEATGRRVGSDAVAVSPIATEATRWFQRSSGGGSRVRWRSLPGLRYVGGRPGISSCRDISVPKGWHDTRRFLGCSGTDPLRWALALVADLTPFHLLDAGAASGFLMPSTFAAFLTSGALTHRSAP